MSRTYHHGKNNLRGRKVRSELNYRKLGGALIFLTQAQLEKEAETEQRRRNKKKQKKNDKKSKS